MSCAKYVNSEQLGKQSFKDDRNFPYIDRKVNINSFLKMVTIVIKAERGEECLPSK